MALSLKDKIQRAERRVRQLKEQLPLQIGKQIIKNDQLIILNPKTKNPKKDKHGNYITRKLKSLDDFNNYFKVTRKSTLRKCKGLFIDGKKWRREHSNNQPNQS